MSGIPHPFTREVCARWFDGLRVREAGGLGLERAFLGETRALVGGVSLDLRSYELGFWVARERWGGGVGTRMVSRFLEEYVVGRGLKYAAAAIHEDNERSIRLVQRCGFEKVGRFPYCFSEGQGPATALFFRKTF